MLKNFGSLDPRQHYSHFLFDEHLFLPHSKNSEIAAPFRGEDVIYIARVTPVFPAPPLGNLKNKSRFVNSKQSSKPVVWAWTWRAGGEALVNNGGWYYMEITSVEIRWKMGKSRNKSVVRDSSKGTRKCRIKGRWNGSSGERKFAVEDKLWIIDTTGIPIHITSQSIIGDVRTRRPVRILTFRSVGFKLRLWNIDSSLLGAISLVRREFTDVKINSEMWI